MKREGNGVKMSVRHLNFYYQSNRALEDISVDFADKSITAVIGPSGCGKSTLLRVFNRIYDLYPGQRAEGEILLNNENIMGKKISVPVLRSRIGMVFQSPTPFPMSIYENIAFPIRLFQRYNRQKLNELVESALRKAALWDEVKDKLRQSGLGLSGGQQQRLCIARAIATQPEILLLDEPASALDPISSEQIDHLMSELSKDYCVILVTHNLGQASRVSQYTAFLYLGKLIEYGTTKQMFNSPREKLTKDYVGGRTG